MKDFFKKRIVSVAVLLFVVASYAAWPVWAAEETVMIDMASYTTAYRASNGANVLQRADGYTVISDGDWAEYTVQIPKAGKYSVSLREVNNGVNIPIYSIAVNNVDKLVQKEGTTSSSFVQSVLGEISFAAEGSYTLKFSKVSGYWAYIDTLTLTCIGEAETDFDVRVPMDSYQEAYNNGDGGAALIKEGEFVTWHGPVTSKGSAIGDWAKYTVTVSEPGKYRFGIKLGGGVGYSTGIRVCVNGEEKINNNEVIIKAEYTAPVDTDMGILEFDEAGWYEFMLENTLADGGQYVTEWYLTYLGEPIRLQSVMAENAELQPEGSVISAGTDYIVVTFSKKVKESDITGTNRKILLYDANRNSIGFAASVNKTAARLSLTESLKPGETYTLYIGSVSDMVLYSTLEPIPYTFSAESGAGSASIVEAAATFDHDLATVTAKMLSSEQVGIKGREFKAYPKAPGGEVGSLPIAEGISGDDGRIVFTYRLPENSADGTYTFLVEGAYTAATAEAEAVYVSANLRQTIVSALWGCTTAGEVQAVLTEYAEYLNIDVSTELSGLDETKVYGHFLEEKIRAFEEIKAVFQRYVAVEKISQAQPNTIESILNDAEIWTALGIEQEKYDVLEEPARHNTVTAVSALEKDLAAASFIRRLQDILLQNIKTQLNKSDLTPAVSDLSVYCGQGVKIPIAFRESFEELTSLTLYAELSDAKMADEAYVTLQKNGKVTTSLQDQTYCIQIVFDRAVSGGSLGEIMITAPSVCGQYPIMLYGSAVYAPKAVSFLVEAAVNRQEFQIGTSSKPSESTGTRGGSSSEVIKSGKGSGGAGTAQKPTQTVPQFEDVPKEHWAYTAVEYLLQKGAVSRAADKKFHPDALQTREDIIKTLVLALGLTEYDAQSSFRDMEPSDPNYKYIATAEKIGLVNGNDEGNFMPNGLMTREDLCVILHRFLSQKLSHTTLDTVFDDDDMISDYAKEAVYFMRSLQLINGVGDNQFLPKGNVTKAQAAKMIYQIVKAVEK